MDQHPADEARNPNLRLTYRFVEPTIPAMEHALQALDVFDGELLEVTQTKGDTVVELTAQVRAESWAANPEVWGGDPSGRTEPMYFGRVQDYLAGDPRFRILVIPAMHVENDRDRLITFLRFADTGGYLVGGARAGVSQVSPGTPDPSHALRRALPQAALDELAVAHVVVSTMPLECHDSIRILAERSLDAPDLRQHPEWKAIKEWLEHCLPDAKTVSGNPGGVLTVVSVKGIVDDVEVGEWWATTRNLDDSEDILDEHRLAYLDEYVRAFAKWEREEVPTALCHITLSIDHEPVLRFCYVKAPDSTFGSGRVLVANAGLELAQCAAELEAKGKAVGWHIWKSRPDAERLQVGLGRRRRRSS